MQTSCSEPSPQEVSDTGTLRLRLTGQSESHLVEHPFDIRSIAQYRFVASGGALYAGAILKGASDGGLYRSEDGISWAPLVKQEELRLDVLNLEGDTLYATDDATIYSLDLCP